jgi:uncharacterized protein
MVEHTALLYNCLARMVKDARHENCRPILLCFAAAALLIGCSGTLVSGQATPAVDYHQHLRDPIYGTPGKNGTVTASNLIDMLDAAGIRRAVVLSTAYGPVKGPPATEADRVRAENDWTAKQISKFPTRLIGFCGINPMKEFALAEIERCSAIRELHYGIKLHFGNSDTDLGDAAKLAKVQAVVAAANRHRMAIAIHMHPSISHRRPYGAREAEIFLNQVLPMAPDVVVQIAHLAGPGGFDSPSDEALQVFIKAIQHRDSRMKRVYFDISGVAGVDDWRGHKSLIVQRVRQIGIQRILWGSDGAFGGGLTPVEALAAFRELPLESSEVDAILANVAPYLR